MREPTDIPLKLRAELPQKFKKDLRLVHYETKSKISLVQRKMQNVLIANAMPTIHLRKQSILARSLCEGIGWGSSKDRKKIFEDLQELSRIQFVFARNLQTSRRRGPDAFSAFISDVEFEEEQRQRCIKYTFGDKVREYIADVVDTDVFDLEAIKRIKSEYALSLYENFHRYRLGGESPWIELELLHGLLGSMHSKHYGETRRFTQKILLPAIKGVNEDTNIEIEYEPHRSNRKVDAIKFYVKEKKNPYQQQELPEVELLTAINPNTLDRLLEIGLSRKVAEEIATSASEAAVEEAIVAANEYGLSLVAKGKGESFNLAGCVVKAIKDQWKPNAGRSRVSKREHELKEQIKVDAKRASLEIEAAKQREAEQAISEKAAALLASYPPDVRQTVEDAFTRSSLGERHRKAIEENPDFWPQITRCGLRLEFEQFVLRWDANNRQSQLI